MTKLKFSIASFIIIIVLLITGCAPQQTITQQTPQQNYTITKLADNVYHIHANKGENLGFYNTYQYTLNTGLQELIKDKKQTIYSITPLTDQMGYGSSTNGLIIIFEDKQNH
jgi:PBP1b-binding outer membrane lipoprotein LpoB